MWWIMIATCSYVAIAIAIHYMPTKVDLQFILNMWAGGHFSLFITKNFHFLKQNYRKLFKNLLQELENYSKVGVKLSQ